MRAVEIAGRAIGPGNPVYVVAELSANHGGDFERARRIVRAARDAGADAVKLQTYTPDALTLDCDRPWFRVGAGTPWEGRRLHDLYAEASTPWEWHAPLSELARELGLHWFSTPFDASAVEFLESLGAPAYKIASFELVDLPLVRRVAATGKPLILSTGMASVDEIDEAVAAARAAAPGSCQGNAAGAPVALLKCTSAYPAPPEEMNLRTIPDLAERFDVPAGLSDHTLGIAVPVAAVALGACLVEKHLTLSRRDGGPDAAFSLEPDEFAAMVAAVRTAERALGRICYEVSSREAASRAFRRSLFVTADVRAGERFTASNVRSIRPADGLAPKHLDAVLGRTARCDIPRGSPLGWELIASH